MSDKREGSSAGEESGPDDLHQEQERSSPPPKFLEYLHHIPGLGGHLPLLMPPLLAAWKASEAGIRLAKILREGLQEDQQLQWPDEETAQLVIAMGEIADTLPSVDHLLPILSDLLEALQQWIEEGGSKPYGTLLLSQLEALGERLLRALFDLALFSPAVIATASRSQELTRLFTHMENLFNRVLTLWISGVGNSSGRRDPFSSPRSKTENERSEKKTDPETPEENGSTP